MGVWSGWFGVLDAGAGYLRSGRCHVTSRWVPAQPCEGRVQTLVNTAVLHLPEAIHRKTHIHTQTQVRQNTEAKIITYSSPALLNTIIYCIFAVP